MDPTAPNDPNKPASPPPPGTPQNPPPVYNPNLDISKPNVSETALDPNDPLVDQKNQGAPLDNGPIQPGQFAVSGTENVAPPPMPPGPNLAQASAPPMPPGPFIPQDQAVQPQVNPAGTQSPISQPDPTPYTPPPPSPGSQGSSGGGSMIKKLRLVAIILGVIVLLGVIGALVWFFILGNTNNSPTQSQTPSDQVQTTIAEPTPLPQRQGGGFGTLPGLPESTSSAPQSTSSALPQ